MIDLPLSGLKGVARDHAVHIENQSQHASIACGATHHLSTCCRVLSHVPQEGKRMTHFPMLQARGVQFHLLDDGAIRCHCFPDRLDCCLYVRSQLLLADVAVEGASLLQGRKHFHSRGLGLFANRLDRLEQLQALCRWTLQTTRRRRSGSHRCTTNTIPSLLRSSD